MRAVSAPLLVLYLTAVGCAGSGESEMAKRVETRVPVLASFASGPDGFEVPDTVLAGEPFVVVFRTSGNSCVEKGQPQIERIADRTIITAYDIQIETPPSTVCRDFGQIFRHVVELQADAAGVSTVEFHGYGDGRLPVVHRFELVAVQPD